MLRFVWWISIVILQDSTAQASNCTVVQNEEMTCYIIPNFKESGCHYFWVNSSHHNLATHLNETNGMVVKKNATHLTTNVCIPVINYSRDCISEKFKFEVTCKASCNMTTGNLSHNLQNPGISQIMIALFVIIPMLVVVVVVVGCCLYRRNTPSTSRNGQTTVNDLY